MSNEARRHVSSTISNVDALRQELEYLAYHGQDTSAKGLYKKIPEQERRFYQSTLVLSSVIRGSIKPLKRNSPPRKTDNLESKDGGAALEQDLNDFIEFCNDRGIRPAELFECIIAVGDALKSMSNTSAALRHYDKAEELGIRENTELFGQLILKKAQILFHLGRITEAHNILSSAAERYYLFHDKNLISEILHLLGKTALLTGRARYFKALLFSGMRLFYTRTAIRRLFAGLVVKTYRQFHRVILDQELSLSDKLLFLVHWVDYRAGSSRMFVKSGIARIAKYGVLGYVYFINYVIGQERLHRHAFLSRVELNSPGREEPSSRAPASTRKMILVTRAMGGIGDLLMMTPGLHALKLKFPSSEIQMVIPRKFAPLFAGNEDVTLIDIETADLDVRSYEKWFNLTDCPAARIESRTMPNVTQNRIDIFARALGIRGGRLRKMNKLPRYFITELEKDFQLNFWKNHGLDGKTVIGIQLQAAEPYRDYPHMADLVRALAKDAVVLLFHTEKTNFGARDSIIDPGPIAIRQAFALAAACSAIVAPDSAFIHFAGAMNIPCVALYGPIDGRVRTMYYPATVSVDVRSILRCIPCWRNEVIPCKLTNMRSSACMTNIAVDGVTDAVKRILRERS
jgi:ADP-heptose:LPS heptosyltransferase/tetratricopeptide (TPR) repeat protein